MDPLSLHMKARYLIWPYANPKKSNVCAGGIFKLELFLPDDYPMTPPKIRFLTKIYHPNIDKLGRICLDVLKSMFLIICSLILLLQPLTKYIRCRQLVASAPNPNDPLIHPSASWRAKSR